jgi:glycosyltransferase involved in cell wall biosynthesis
MGGLTIVIPTHNRCHTLEKALEAYQAQTALGSIAEILVIDDGSTDSTSSIVAELSKRSVVPIRYLRQGNKGPATARNWGLREAKTPLILFTDDDIIPTPTLVAEHLAWHTKNPDESVAVLGYVTWSPEVNATPFMIWYGSDGALFSYGHFVPGSQLEFTDFYSCNVSLKTEFIRRNGGFDEDFKIAAYEDTELAYRLQKAGMKLFYNQSALAFHLQQVSFESACRRVWKTHSAGKLFQSKEAGIYYRSKSDSGKSKTNNPWRKRHLVQFLALLLTPFKGLMDWRMPLPWGIYKFMFRIFCSSHRFENCE